MGLVSIEKLSFDAYNELEILPIAEEQYKERNGHYPKEFSLTRSTETEITTIICLERSFCIFCPSLGRPKKESKVDKKAEDIDNADREEFERAFSLAKRCYELGLIRNKSARIQQKVQSLYQSLP